MNPLRSFMPQSLLALALGTAALAATAQDYPTQPIQMFIPAPAGGITDATARRLAESLKSELGQSVSVVSRAGGGLTLATSALVGAAADGYTLMYAPVTSITVQLHRNKKLPYTKDSVIPLCQAMDSKFLLAVGPKSQFKDARALIAAARSNTGKVQYGTVGVASSPHLAAAELWLNAGMKVADIPYAGEAPLTMALLSGDLEAGVVGVSGIISAKLRPLAVFGKERVAEFPDVPTFSELQLSEIEPSGYGGLFVRAGTPTPIVQRLEEACRKIVTSAVYRDFAKARHIEPAYLDRAAFTARINADHAAKKVLLDRLKLPE